MGRQHFPLDFGRAIRVLPLDLPTNAPIGRAIRVLPPDIPRNASIAVGRRVLNGVPWRLWRPISLRIIYAPVSVGVCGPVDFALHELSLG
jgi:hypothetical protein